MLRLKRNLFYLKNRYNNFQNDSLSACNCTPPYSAELTIAARCDLNPVNGTYPHSVLGHRPYGATDAKVRTHNYKEVQLLSKKTV